MNKIKTYIMKSILKYIIGVLVLLTVLISSCTKDFEEINTHPHSFNSASDGILFNKIIQSLIPSGNEHMYINNEILYKQSQQAALTKEAWGNFTIGTEAMWSNYYTILPNVRELEKRFDAAPDSPEIVNMKAMLKIVMAYKTFKMTDVFGDMPYSDAGYGYQDLDYLRPKYDRQESIYKYLLEDLKWCDDHINDTVELVEPFRSFLGFDRLFNGQMDEWRKLANSLSLRYAMRMSNKEPELAGQIIKNIIDNNRPIYLGYDFITYLGESACLRPASMGFSNGGMDWSFREHSNLRMGSTVWSQMSDTATGIFDPRAYIFFEGNNDGEWSPYPQLSPSGTPASGGIPYGSHRDNAGAFGVKGETCIYSPFNYFFTRDVDFMPIPIITGAEMHFIIAEAYLRGVGLPQDATQAEFEYMDGINSSVEWWINEASRSQLPTSGLSFFGPGMIEIPSNIGPFTILNVFGLWNAPTDEDKLRFIYAQRWIDAMRQPWEAYALARRTGMTPREGDPINHFRLPYPPSEVEYNTAMWYNALSNQGGGDTPEYKIWWVQ